MLEASLSPEGANKDGELTGQILGRFFFAVFLGIIILATSNALFKISDRFAEAAADLRQFAGSEYDQCDHQDYH